MFEFWSRSSGMICSVLFYAMLFEYEDEYKSSVVLCRAWLGLAGFDLAYLASLCI